MQFNNVFGVHALASRYTPSHRSLQIMHALYHVACHMRERERERERETDQACLPRAERKACTVLTTRSSFRAWALTSTSDVQADHVSNPMRSHASRKLVQGLGPDLHITSLLVHSLPHSSRRSSWLWPLSPSASPQLLFPPPEPRSQWISSRKPWRPRWR